MSTSPPSTVPNGNAGRTLRDQLLPVSVSLRETHAHIQPVCQVTLRLKSGKSGDRFAVTVNDILRWMNNRAGKRLPQEAWDLKSFELTDVGAQRTSAVSLTNPSYWTARLDDADKTVARRTWITEIGVGIESNQDVLFGTRLTCVARGENPPFLPAVPGFVRSVLAGGICEADGRVADGKPRLVSTELDVEWLVELLEQRDRICDVVVLTHQESDETEPRTIANANLIAQQLQGVAHVVVLTSDGSYALTERVGKELSVFRQAVRTYRPGFRSWLDEPGRHPLALATTMQAWPNGGIASFEKALCAKIVTNTAYVPDREARLPSFTSVRHLAAKIERDAARKGGATDAQMLKLFEDDNQRLATEIQEQKELSGQLLSEAERERDEATERANEAVAQVMLAGERIRRLEARLAATSDLAVETPVPTDLTGFEDWCKEHLAGSVVVHNRALQGAKKSEYHDPKLIYQSLLALRDRYVPMRIHGGTEYQEAYAMALAAMHVEESATGDGAKFEGSEYAVQYLGKKRILERHLKAGNSREARFCFRLYFFWEDTTQVAVVGWLPSHLENRMS